MSQATVYLGDEVVARDVTGLDPAEGGVCLTTLFEEPTFVPGQIRHIDFLRHRVLLDPLEEVDSERA